MKQTTEHYDRVKEFMQLAGQDVPEEVTIPSPEIRRLLAKSILEEALETVEALGIIVTIRKGTLSRLSLIDELALLEFRSIHEPNLEELIDGCTDISVATIRTLIAFGLPDIPFLEETDRANLRKFDVPKCEICNRNMRVANISGRNQWICPKSLEADHYASPIIHRYPFDYGPYTRFDDKHNKPPYWKPPNHSRILEGLTDHFERT